MASIQQKYIDTIKQHENVCVIEGKYVKKPILLRRDTMQKIKQYLGADELQTYIEKGVDVKIAVDMIKLALDDSYDAAILVSGDSDFVPVISQLKELKKKVQVAMFMNDQRKSYDLKEHCKSIIRLDYIIPPIIRKQKAANE